MFDGTEIAARRNWLLKPNISAFGKLSVNLYISVTIRIAFCHAIRSLYDCPAILTTDNRQLTTGNRQLLIPMLNHLVYQTIFFRLLRRKNAIALDVFFNLLE